jgi:acetoin utilization deacetylase AcuC-like enzyme
MPPAASAYVWDPDFLKHDTGESAQRLPDGSVMEAVEHYSNNRITNRTAQLIRGVGLEQQLLSVPTRAATMDEIEYAHAPAYIQSVRRITAEGGGMLDDQTRVCHGSWEAALLAAGGALELTDAVLEGRARNGYGLLRPIGHHAMPEQGMGFCVFNNVVIATRHAQRRRGVGRIAIVDWDVHHGNGTQTAFWDDPEVLFISLHQNDWYPGGWGKVEDTGGDAARGATVNIPLPAGTGNYGYELALERVVEPILRQFEPELLFISAGQDANMADPLGRMLVTTAGFRRMAERLRRVADDVCKGQVIGFQEGGYSSSYTPFCTLAVVEGITGISTRAGDPWAGSSEHSSAEHVFSDDQVAAITAAREIQSQCWQI